MIYHDGGYNLLADHGSCCQGENSDYNIRVGRARILNRSCLIQTKRLELEAHIKIKKIRKFFKTHYSPINILLPEANSLIIDERQYILPD
jgi:hypothetical protein